jgi:hypothetical protein
LKELQNWEPRPVVCDNNLLASSRTHFDKVIDSLKRFDRVDFNQGLDASLFTSYHAGRIAELKGCKVRFSLDDTDDRADVAAAIDTAINAGLKDIGIYVLIGFDDTPEEAQSNLEWVRQRGIRPNPMRFQPLDGDCSLIKDSYVAPGWTKDQLRNIVRYYSRLRFLEHIPFGDYHYGADEQERLL